MGRPIESVPQDIADQLVDWISEGKSLRAFARQPGKPSYRSLYRWREKDSEFASHIACAREEGEDAIAEESLEIIDEKPTYVDADGVERIDPAGIQRNFRRAEHRLKLLAKWNPKKFGERVTHAGDDTAPLVVRHIGKPIE